MEVDDKVEVYRNPGEVAQARVVEVAPHSVQLEYLDFNTSTLRLG